MSETVSSKVETTVSAKIIHADGTIEDLGVLNQIEDNTDDKEAIE